MEYFGLAAIGISMALWAAEVRPTLVRYFRKNPWRGRTEPRVNVQLQVRKMETKR